jgi:hypothetical protein
MTLYTALAVVQRRVIVVLLQGTEPRYKRPPLFVSCPTMVIGTRCSPLPSDSECVIVKSVFGAAGVVPNAFQTFMFMSASVLLIVEPKFRLPLIASASREIQRSTSVIACKLPSSVGGTLKRTHSLPRDLRAAL